MLSLGKCCQCLKAFDLGGRSLEWREEGDVTRRPERMAALEAIADLLFQRRDLSLDSRRRQKGQKQRAGMDV